MPKRTTSRVEQASAAALPNPPQNPSYFPFAAYASAVGVHTSLHAFSALFVPQTPGIVEFISPGLDPSLVSSKDRPQAEFLDALTRSPVATLVCICCGAVVLQSWWGGWIRAWRIDSLLQGSGDEKKVARARVNARRLVDMRDAWLATVIASSLFFFVLVLMGAPLTSHLAQTYLLSLLLALLTTYVPTYTFGSPLSGSIARLTYTRLFADLSSRTPVERAILYPSVGTVIGSWIGAIPIALDWDRPWQAWPLTPATGAIAGYILASIAALTASSVRFSADEHIRSLASGKSKTT
ncbi:hypothetical protein MKEN_00229600 [Mycena kentingensis (nom. inval.)]|nr:hypothetical protein MKEN_00229600 [Mycena kentingensis (nom. inval.)]